MSLHAPRCAMTMERCDGCGNGFRRALAQMHRCPARGASDAMALHSLRQMARTPLVQRSEAIETSAAQLATLLRDETAQLLALSARVEDGGRLQPRERFGR
jgi:hypothetical protein